MPGRGAPLVTTPLGQQAPLGTQREWVWGCGGTWGSGGRIQGPAWVGRGESLVSGRVGCPGRGISTAKGWK